MFENYRVFETTVAGRPLVVETGKIAQLANGSCLVRYGETVVLCNVTASAKPRDGVDFFPLSVDYEEKLYSVGKSPGSFLRREGRPSEKAILTSRVIDRPIRPLFPKDMRNDVSVVCTVMSVDPDCAPDIVAMIGTSIAISISDIPWGGPTAACCGGLVDGKFVINPTRDEEARSEMHVTVASTADLVAMLEAGANEIDNDTMFDGIMAGHAANQEVVAFINKIVAEIGKPKFPFTSNDPDPEMFEAIKEFAIEMVRAALDTDDKRVRDERLKPVYEQVHAHFDPLYPELEGKIDECLYKLQKFVVRRWLLDDGKRVDGRGINDMRPLAAEVDLLPRVHGSGMFTRGQTQVLTTCTLGTAGDAQLLEVPSTVGLASEVVSSTRATSRASICGSTLALMAAGVPIKAPVAGISCGLITEGDRFMTMVDIQGLEDFFGDMDFKVGGTKKGITAIQMDLKVHGLTPAIIREALDKTYAARCYILDEVMLKAIPEVRSELSKWAPKMLSTKIDVDKIREVIGKGGSVIQKIQADCNCDITIEEDGSVFIAAVNTENAKHALMIVETIAKDPEIGAVYCGRVTRLMTFGAFVEIAPGKEGLVHISKLDVRRVERVEDVVNVGDQIRVRVVEIDEQGRINLSRKDALVEGVDYTAEEAAAAAAESGNRPARNGGHRPARNGGHRRDRRDD